MSLLSELRRWLSNRGKSGAGRTPDVRVELPKDASADERTTSRIDRLRRLLAERNFREADLLTAEILCGGDTWTKVTVEGVDAVTLDTLDQIWSSASAGRFGFRAQCQLGVTDDEVFDKAQIPNWWSWESKRIYDLSAPLGHLPMAWLFGEPVGHDMGNDRGRRYFQLQHVRKKLL